MKTGEKLYIISSYCLYLNRHLELVRGRDKAYPFTKEEKDKITDKHNMWHTDEVESACQDIVRYNRKGKSTIVGKEYGYCRYECGTVEETMYTRVEMGFEIFEPLERKYNWRKLLYRYRQEDMN